MPEQLTTFEITRILDRIAQGFGTNVGDAIQIARLLWRESVSHIAQYAAGAWLATNGEPNGQSRILRSRPRSRHVRRPLSAVHHAPTAEPRPTDAPAATATATATGRGDRPIGAILTPATILERPAADEALLPHTPTTGDAPERRTDL